MKDSNHCSEQAVNAFLSLISQADAVLPLGAPVLSSWEASQAVGDPSNQVLAFRWEDREGSYGFHLTEEGISAGRWVADAFICADDEGDEVQLTLVKQVPITPSQLVNPEQSDHSGLVEVAEAGACPRLYAGYWEHLFGPGSRASQCRIVIDQESSTLLAAQVWVGIKFEDLDRASLANLADSLFNANSVHLDPTEFSLELVTEMPKWAAPQIQLVR